MSVDSRERAIGFDSEDNRRNEQVQAEPDAKDRTSKDISLDSRKLLERVSKERKQRQELLGLESEKERESESRTVDFEQKKNQFSVKKCLLQAQKNKQTAKTGEGKKKGRKRSERARKSGESNKMKRCWRGSNGASFKTMGQARTGKENRESSQNSQPKSNWKAKSGKQPKRSLLSKVKWEREPFD